MPPLTHPTWWTPLWVVVHVVFKYIDGLYELWRVREIYTLSQTYQNSTVH